jgi:DNA-binding transcriptional MerR regulator
LICRKANGVNHLKKVAKRVEFAVSGAYDLGMDESITLAELAEKSGVEARTIRSYIERGLLPSADSRGRGAAGYTQEHLTRLRLIQSIRRARPNVQLNEIRLLFQQSSSEQLRHLAGGTLTTAAPASPVVEGQDTQASSSSPASVPRQGDEDTEEQFPVDPDATPPEILTAAHKLLRALRQLTDPAPTPGGSKVESWHRIAINADVELSVRGEFGPDQLAVFRQVADLLRHLLARSEQSSQEEGK